MGRMGHGVIAEIRKDIFYKLQTRRSIILITALREKFPCA